MITEAQACLRYISSVHRRKVRDVLARSILGRPIFQPHLHRG